MLQQIPLTQLTIAKGDVAYSPPFSDATLVIVEDYGSVLWYIDVNGLDDRELLDAFSTSMDIKVELTAVRADGGVYRGTGYLHPNSMHAAAAIRGDGELLINY